MLRCCCAFSTSKKTFHEEEEEKATTNNNNKVFISVKGNYFYTGLRTEVLMIAS